MLLIDKKCLRFTLFVLSILGQAITINAAVVTGNDGSGYITKAEFAASKGEIQYEIETLTKNLNTIIDGSIGTVINTLNGGGQGTDDDRLDLIFPIGYVLLQNTPPTFGTWEEITDVEGRCLWVDSTCSFGQCIPEGMPMPKWNVEKETHTHTFTGTTVTSSASGSHNHVGSVTIPDPSSSITTSGSTTESGNKVKGTENAKLEHEKHKHLVTPKAETTEVEHTHTITLNSPFNGAPGSKVQPNAYVVKMWKRTA